MKDNIDMDFLMKLVQLKKENPEEYKKTLIALKEVFKDITALLEEIMRDVTR